MSLAARLSRFFLVALALVLGGFSVTLYLLSRAHFQADLDEHLGLALDALTPSVEVDPGRIQWKPATTPPLVDGHSVGEQIRWAVYRGNGQLVDSSWELDKADLSRIFEQSPRSGHVHATFIDQYKVRWRMAIRRVSAPSKSAHDDQEADDKTEQRPQPPPKSEEALSVVLATGVPLESTEAGLRNVSVTLASVSGTIWMLAAVVGRRLCRRALLPVSRMANVACAMSASDRDQRLPSPGTGDELDALANSFNGLLDRLHQALERQRRFTGDASHQLRTPLAGLLGQIEVTRRRDRPAEEYRLALDLIHAEASRLRQIVDSLLFMARAENEAAKPELVPLDLSVWLSGHLSRWADHPRSADIQADIPADFKAEVQVHPQLLAQLVDNLLDNACKYSKPETPIHVRLEHDRAGGMVELSVQDHGFGIATEDLNAVFDPFFRSADVRRRGQPGVGLGLSVVKRIADVFGGTVRAESRSGEGSRFVLRLSEADPAGGLAYRNAAPARCPTPPEPALTSGNMTAAAANPGVSSRSARLPS